MHRSAITCCVLMLVVAAANAESVSGVAVKNNCPVSKNIGLSYSPNGTARVVEPSADGWELQPAQVTVLASDAMEKYRPNDHRIAHHTSQPLLVQVDGGEWKPVSMEIRQLPDETGKLRHSVVVTLCAAN